MRRRQLKWLWRRLKELQGMDCKRDELLKKLVLLELPGDFPLAGVRGPERRQRSF
jgi:hypothetical protein